jgi:hypothetical protein
MKTSPEDIDVLLVGGGSIICPGSLRGVSRIMYVFPEHFPSNVIKDYGFFSITEPHHITM